MGAMGHRLATDQRRAGGWRCRVNDLPLRWQILLPIALVLLLGVLSPFASLLALHASSRGFRHAGARHWRLTTDLTAIQSDHLRHRLLVTDFLTSAHPQARARIEQQLAAVEGRLRAATSRSLESSQVAAELGIGGDASPQPRSSPALTQRSAGRRADSFRLGRISQRYLRATARVLGLARSGRQQEAHVLSTRVVQPLLLQASQIATAMFHAENEQLAARHAEATRVASRRLTAVVVICCLAAVAALALTLGLARSLTRRLGALLAGAQTFAAGTLSSVIDVTARDEIGTIARQLNDMASRLSELLSELRTSEGRLRSVVDSSEAIIYIKDTAGRYLLANRQLAELVGLDAREIVGRTDGEVFGSAAAAAFSANDRLVIEARCAMEFEERVRDDSVSPVYLSAKFPLFTERGEIYGVGGISTDITQRKQVEQLKSDFVAAASHDLRTPLTSIRGAIGLLDGAVFGPLPDKARELVRIAVVNTDRLIRLVNTMLDLEKIEAGQLELRLERVPLSEIVDETIASLAALAAGSRVALVADVPDTKLAARGDRDHLLRVLTNLLGNALKVSPTGGRVTLSGAADGPDWLRLAVTDQGPGIGKRAQAQLFRKYYQVQAGAHSKGGTGLGLALCKAIVEQHGGVVGVQSEVGRGATFFVRLPREHDPPSPSTTTATTTT